MISPESQLNTPISANISPGTLKVIKREGNIVAFDTTRIKTALKNAFVAVEGQPNVASEKIQDTVENLTTVIVKKLEDNWVDGGIIHIEAIQDMVELALMRQGEHQVARSYVLYREQRRLERVAQNTSENTTSYADEAEVSTF